MLKPHASDGTYVYAERNLNLMSSQPIKIQQHFKKFLAKRKVYTFEDGVYGPTSKNLAESWGLLFVTSYFISLPW